MPWPTKEKAREYSRQWRGKNGEHARAYARKYYTDNPDKAKIYRQKRIPKDRAYYLEKVIGITLEQFEALFDWQGRVCCVCGTAKSGGHNWHIDHDHKTGYIRGILCCKCNRALGWVSDNPATLRALADYLETR